MFDKFSYQNLIITLIPGGFFISVLILTLPQIFPQFSTKLPEQDFLLTFMFLAISLAAGEAIQTLGHSMEALIDFIFFKGYRPSEIFLLPGNPILGEHQLQQVLEQNVYNANRHFLTEYSKVSRWKRLMNGKEHFAAQSQQVFRLHYTKNAQSERVQDANARYLFVRGMFVVCLITAGWFCYIAFLRVEPNVRIWHVLALTSAFFALLFLYRARGYGKGLVCEVAYLSTKTI